MSVGPQVSASAHTDAIARPALTLVIGRAAGLAASFAIGIVLARLFSPAEFGTYKQFFLIYATLYGLAQLGMAESLYYFVPRQTGSTSRYVANALLTLTLAGAACTAALVLGRTQIAEWLSNAPLADHLGLLGAFLTFMLISTVLEIVLISRKRHFVASVTYALSDIGRTVLFVAPALLFADLRSVFIGATIFAGLRLAFMLVSLWREHGRELRLDVALWKQQLAYALPFALAVGIEVIQINYHQYVVASRFDAATFAIYAVGCLQIPLVDLIVTSTVNVLMVKMGEEASHGQAALALWHETVKRMAFLIFPLAAFLVVSAHVLIVGVFTSTYAASVPIFVVWSLTMLHNVLAADAVLRVYAQTRFLLLMNLLRLGLVAVLIGWCLNRFGLTGAVIVTLVATTFVKFLGVMRITRVMGVPLLEALPWGALARIGFFAALSALPVVWLYRAVSLGPLVLLVIGGVVYAGVYALLSFGPMLMTRVAPPLDPARPGVTI